MTKDTSYAVLLPHDAYLLFALIISITNQPLLSSILLASIETDTSFKNRERDFFAGSLETK